MRKFRLLTICLALLLIGPLSVQARELRQGDQCVIERDEVLLGDVFILCRALNVNGTIRGNLLGAATTAEISGAVEGDLYLLAGQLTISGRIRDSIHFIGPALRILPSAILENPGAGLLSASLSTTIADGARIPDSIIGIGYQLLIEGTVDGEINFWGSALEIDGTIGGDVSANVGDSESAGVAELQTLLTLLPIDIELIRPGLRVRSGAAIGGTLSYSSPSEGIIEAELAHPPVFTEVIVQPDLAQIATITEPEDAERELGYFLSQVVREFLTLFLVGALLLLLAPAWVQSLLRTLNSRPLPSLGLGLITFILSFPVLVILALFSLLVVLALGLVQLGDFTIAGAFLLGAGNFGLASIFYFAAIFISRALVCLALGRWLTRVVRSGADNRSSQYVYLLVGTVVLTLIFSLPTIGWWLSAVAAFLGLGTLLLYIQGHIETRRRIAVPRPAGVILPSKSQEARYMPPPILDSSLSQQPGMDNLPPGFRWWDDD